MKKAVKKVPKKVAKKTVKKAIKKIIKETKETPNEWTEDRIRVQFESFLKAYKKGDNFIVALFPENSVSAFGCFNKGNLMNIVFGIN